MVRNLIAIGGCCLLLLAGCSQPTEELRTYSEGTDGDAASAQVDEPAEVSEPTQPGATTESAQAAATASDAREAASPEPAPGANVATTVEPAAPVASETARPPRPALPVRIALAGTDGAAASFTSTAVSDEPREIKLLVTEKEFPRLDGGRTLRVSYDDLDLLKVLNMEPVPENCVDYFPEWLKGLDGQQVRLRGFMYPPARDSGLPGFVLARDNQICCFGRNPKVYDIIPVMLKEGTTTNYIPNRPFDVVGRLLIRPEAYRGKLENLYEIEDAEVITQ